MNILNTLKQWLEIIKGDPLDQLHTLSIDGRTRHYILHTPLHYQGEQKYPLVFAFHGGKERVRHLKRNTGFSAIANQHHFFVAYPFGVRKNWNDGRGTVNTHIDDIAFVDAMLEDIQQQVNINSQQIYASGASNGGLFTQRLACELDDKIAAFATIVASMAQALQHTCRPQRPIPLMMINGTQDPLMPWHGGHVRGKKGDVMAVPALLNFWLKHNQLDSNEFQSEILSFPKGEGETSVYCQRYGAGSAAEIVYYEVDNGGHTWPGGKAWQMKFLLGKANDDIDGAGEIWKFFQRHRLP